MNQRLAMHEIMETRIVVRTNEGKVHEGIIVKLTNDEVTLSNGNKTLKINTIADIQEW